MRLAGGFWVVVGLVLVGMTAVTLSGVISEFFKPEGPVSPGELGRRIRLSRGYSLVGLGSLIVGMPLLIVGVVRAERRRRVETTGASQASQGE